MSKFFIVLFAIAIHLNGHAQICWIKDVAKMPNGVTVTFMPKVSPAVYSSKINQYSDGKYCRISNNILSCKDGFTSVGLFLKTGTSVTVSNNHHDFCTLKAIEKDGTIGVQAHALLRLPGLPTEEADEFFSTTK